MEMISVSSSNIAAIGYEANSEILRIEFRDGRIYEYFDVPQSEHEALMAAPSKGKYAHQNIYKNYRSNKVA